MERHQPVMVEEVLEHWVVDPAGSYLDATLGRGGHSRALLSRYPGARVLGCDRDPEALRRVRQESADAFADRLRILQLSFAQLGELAERFDGLLFDLGVSSEQLSDAARGFSFRLDGPLDMRMDPAAGPTAAELIDGLDEETLGRLLRDYGGERRWRRAAAAIVNERPFADTRALAEVVRRAVGPSGRLDPATRTFQALRIAINDELGELDRVLPVALEALTRGGRLAIISFHSLEDRRVKRFMRDEARGDAPPDMPLREDQIRRRLTLVGGARRAGEAEVDENPRARSAVLRVAERRD